MITEAKTTTWRGYDSINFSFEGYYTKVVFPKERKEPAYLAIKTVYWDAFPEAIETTLLEQGFYLCYIHNDNRWGTNPDLDRKARLIRFLQAGYHLQPKCVPIGMSCGGLMAIKLAARYPELIQCLYLDAPVVNYMSCPCGFGVGKPLSEDNSEILQALGLSSISELLAYREMPLDQLPTLVKHHIPVILVAGDSDMTVPYCENGIWIEKAYKEAGEEIEVYIKPGCDHHPHGLEEPSVVWKFIEKHCR